MSNKLCCIFFIVIGIFAGMNNLHAANVTAYDDDTGGIVEIFDFDYDTNKLTEGQIIEYYDFGDGERKNATIDSIEDNFSLITLLIVDNDTKDVRLLTIRIE